MNLTEKPPPLAPDPVPGSAGAAPTCGFRATRPSWLITIDTEGDNSWSRSRRITTRNAAYLPRFQELCERHGLKATYLVNWEMVNSPEFQEFGREVLRRGTGEIGAHLHAWNSPPLDPLTDDDAVHLPYAMEYPEPQIREKIRTLTDRLEDTFGAKMHSHRAGRWGFNEVYARVLVDAGYGVDCSVTPHVSWALHRGDPGGRGGPDYSGFPESAYCVDLQDIRRSGDSRLLEVPMTIVRPNVSNLAEAVRRLLETLPGGPRVSRRFVPRLSWLRPNGRNLKDMQRILDVAVRERRDYAEFMLHSSELMPGGSPMFPTDKSIELLYDHLEALFGAAAGSFEGLTLREFERRFRALRVGRGPVRG
jgi:hypothetical protein